MQSPELIPTKTEDQQPNFTREAGLPGSGFTDLVGVDVQGNVLIVETKLVRSGEIHRKVIGLFAGQPNMPSIGVPASAEDLALAVTCSRKESRCRPDVPSAR
jgi:hypothetical protein